MGAYLSEPVKETHSIDEANEFLQVGASSMQGWRISQEDAHNCILKLDENTSYFAVYDGHGGAEVAKYCSEHLPNFLKNLQSFKDGKYEEALKEAFLKFDSTLLEESVIEELKRIAGERNPAGNSSNIVDEEEEEDLAELCQEGSLPLEKVLAKYKAKKDSTLQDQDNNKNEEAKPGSSGTSKPLSPRLRGKRNTGKSPENEAACTSAYLSGEGTSDSVNFSEPNDDSEVSSSEAKCIFEKKVNEEECEMKSSEAISVSGGISKTNGDKIITEPIAPASTSSIQSSTSPDSSVSNSIKDVQNGDLKTELSSGVSSSTSNNENGPKPSEPENKENSDLDLDDKDYVYFEEEEDEDSSECEECSEEYDEYEKEFNAESSDEEADDWMYKDDTYGDDKFCANMIEEPGKDSGCTAVVALLNGRDLYVANAGDSRCVVCRGGKAIDMSIDHKPEDDEELKRIKKAGGHVTFDGRVNGGLNLSRAIGDHAYKMNSKLKPEEQMISALPDVKKLILEPNDEFMILACDGIWNYMSSEEVVELVKEFIDEDFEEMSSICEELLNTCLSPSTLGDGTGCDNMTAIIIRFKPTIFELSTKLNPDETILNEEKKVSDSEKPAESTSETEDKPPKTKKRSISPTSSDNSDLTSTAVTGNDSEEQSKKRFKSSAASSSSTLNSEISTEANNKTANITNAIEQNDNQSQMDTATVEPETLVTGAETGVITTTSET
ncbi:probable protein phosphatase CG10417 [Condylostylus longicornis]|uniref:probable protein phosphatase CG10417 n=1 Tax=Condylostylus longicornis TaxID=2530218 RepID=UPI00244E2138|nr:probable protein phosphatase CG10417 [Condylostylus longicornis]